LEISFTKVGYLYQPKTPYEFRALQEIDLKIAMNKVTALIGHTGSGKSTLLQHLNAILKPSEGVVKIGNSVIDSTTSEKNLKPIRKKVGIVFQFPEAQLFEETVLKDVAFGAQNFGVAKEEAYEEARSALRMVGISEELDNNSPLELSGGQMRRVAIAGVLAMRPVVLVLDEPTAGLDPKGKIEIMQMFSKLHCDFNLTIILVTHSMDDVASYADFVYVLNSGKIVLSGEPKFVFSKFSLLREIGLGLPKAADLALKLRERGFVFKSIPLTVSELAQAMADNLKGV